MEHSKIYKSIHDNLTDAENYTLKALTCIETAYNIVKNENAQCNEKIKSLAVYSIEDLKNYVDSILPIHGMQQLLSAYQGLIKQLKNTVNNDFTNT